MRGLDSALIEHRWYMYRELIQDVPLEAMLAFFNICALQFRTERVVSQ